MAVTKTITARGSKGHHTYNLTVTEMGTNTTNNTSTLSFDFTLVDDNNWYWESQGTRVAYEITIGSHTYSGYIPHHTTQTTDVRSETGITETHNNDGTKTINISFTVTDSTSISYLSGDASASGTLTLTTIPRASDVTVSAQTISAQSGNVSFQITSKADFYHEYRYSVNGVTSTWIRAGQVNNTTTTFNISNENILSAMSNTNLSALTVEVKTYTSVAYTTLVGTKSGNNNITVTLKPTAPTLTTFGFYSRSSGVDSSITTPTAGYTTVALTSWSAGTSYGTTSGTTFFTIDSGASLKTTSATANNTVIETNTLPANSKAYTLTISAKTIDGRSIESDTTTKSVTVYGYSTPKLTLKAYRTATNASTDTTEDASGVYAYVTFSNTLKGLRDAVGSLISPNPNSVLSATCKYGSTSVTSGQHISLAPENTITFTYTVQDKFTTTKTSVTVNAAKFPLDLYDDGAGHVGVGIGTIAVADKFTSALPIVGNLEITEVSNVVTRTSGYTIGSCTLCIMGGKIAQLTLQLMGDGSTVNVGSNCFVGTIASAYKPRTHAGCATYSGSSGFILSINSSGGVSVRVIGANATMSTTNGITVDAFYLIA